GPGGSIYLLAGTGGFDSGDVNINAGSAGIDGSGGDVNLTGGTGTGNPLNTGGSINFFPGPGPTGEGVVRSFGRFVVAQFTTLQILAIVGPDEGSVVYDTDEHTMKYFNGTSWVAF